MTCCDERAERNLWDFSFGRHYPKVWQTADFFSLPDFLSQLDFDLASSFLIISHHGSTKAAQ
jgi:hypothetical protein